MKLNVAPILPPIRAHEGAPAQRINAETQLRRSVMSCMLWEDEFYESGQSVAQRIAETIKLVKPEKVAAIAVEAREQMKLRHVPLLIVREMARLSTHRHLVAATLSRVVQRPDELSEFVAIYWKEGRQTLSAQVKKGLALAFQKFNAYSLAKYNRAGSILLRDVLFLCHAKPKDAEQDALWKQLINDELPTPDTWEVELSASKDKLASWTRLLSEEKLGALALLRNLRNMQNANVPDGIIRTGISKLKTERVLPFRFIAAARHAPTLEDGIEPVMLRCAEGAKKLSGHTVLLVDVSGSMDQSLSLKSDLKRIDAANGLAMLLREVCERVSIYSFSMKLCAIPTRRGFALRDAIHNSQDHSGTPLGIAVQSIYADRNSRITQLGVQNGWGYQQVASADYAGQGLRPDRLIVITDEQSQDQVPPPAFGKGYMLNVASAKNGVGYGKWTHIDGFSESVVEYIITSENAETFQAQ